jgi:hypothetical protein
MFMTMSDFSPGEYALVGFAGFWGLVGLGIISIAAYFWLKERRTMKLPTFSGQSV